LYKQYQAKSKKNQIIPSDETQNVEINEVGKKSSTLNTHAWQDIKGYPGKPIVINLIHNAQ